MSEEMRKEFEEWWRSVMNADDMPLDRTRYPMTETEKQQYMCHETNRSWLAWQASREAMKPIKLPKSEYVYRVAQHEMTAVIDLNECREAIKLAGYKVEE